MSEHRGISRRTALGLLAGTAAGTALPGALSGGSPFSPALAAKNLTVGLIYVGPRDDFGYNQAHAEARRRAEEDARRQGGRGRERAETAAVQKTMESMISQDGATLVFPTSFGYFDPHMLAVAQKYPDVAVPPLRRAVDRRQAPEATPAATSATSTSASTSTASSPAMHARAKKIGFVAAKPIPQVLRNINAFTLGARSVNPTITTQVIFTGDWSMPVKEAEATNSLVDQALDVFTCTSTARRSWWRPPSDAATWSAATTPTRRSWRPRAT